ncbi:MAG: hypothetical protein NTV89_18045 [Proteobacteria bacterium]|nr:hypothetical protein [Pseudomonadota bacterium]
MQKNINFDYNDIVPYFEEELNKKQIKNAVRYIAEEYDMGKISEVSFEFFVTTLLISFI